MPNRFGFNGKNSFGRSASGNSLGFSSRSFPNSSPTPSNSIPRVGGNSPLSSFRGNSLSGLQGASTPRFSPPPRAFGSGAAAGGAAAAGTAAGSATSLGGTISGVGIAGAAVLGVLAAAAGLSAGELIRRELVRQGFSQFAYPGEALDSSVFNSPSAPGEPVEFFPRDFVGNPVGEPGQTGTIFLTIFAVTVDEAGNITSVVRENNGEAVRFNEPLPVSPYVRTVSPGRLAAGFTKADGSQIDFVAWGNDTPNGRAQLPIFSIATEADESVVSPQTRPSTPTFPPIEFPGQIPTRPQTPPQRNPPDRRVPGIPALPGTDPENPPQQEPDFDPNISPAPSQPPGIDPGVGIRPSPGFTPDGLLGREPAVEPQADSDRRVGVPAETGTGVESPPDFPGLPPIPPIPGEPSDPNCIELRRCLGIDLRPGSRLDIESFEEILEEFLPNEDDDDEGDEEDKRIIGAIVLANFSGANRATEIFQSGGNPNIFAPRIGSVAFKIRIGRRQFWTHDLDVKYSKQVITCPFPYGAVNVRGTGIPGVQLSLIKVFKPPGLPIT